MDDDPRFQGLLERYVPTIEGRRALRKFLAALDVQSDDSATLDDFALDGEGREDAPERYEDLGRLAVGGMGEVRRVRDTVLGRMLAMKVLRRKWAGHDAARQRFEAEARITASLQHPGVVPVHDIGVRDDGRPFFTMQEVQGRTLAAAIRELHAEPDAPMLRRVVSALHRAVEAVAHAHQEGVVHRDLKPSNIMIGPLGAVYVLDWGLAKRAGASSEGRAGTPAYVAPEQLSGAEAHPRADVFSLGCSLYEVLYGASPFAADSTEAALERVREGRVTWPTAPVPEALVEACARALQAAPEARFADARELAEAMESWLEGTRRREAALQRVEAARATQADAVELSERAAGLRLGASEALEAMPPTSGEDLRAPHWDALDRAEDLDRQAAAARAEADALLQAALSDVPDLVEAHREVARRVRVEHERAEEVRDLASAALLARRLTRHAMALPAGDDERMDHMAWLSGRGRVVLRADRPARVTLLRYVSRRRRLAAEPVDVADAPFERQLAHGSYLALVEAPGCATARVPFHLDRCGEALIDVVLPSWVPAGSCYVPAGPFVAGGDPRLDSSLPRQRVHVDGFVIQRFPVTNAEYIAFLDALVADGRHEEAERWQPRERGEAGVPIYGRDDDGRFVLVPDADGHLWQLQWPVVMVDWDSARAYAAWLAEQSGQPWRLPHELEWEKAYRGVDGRFYPWGDAFDPTFCCNRHSHAGEPLPATVDRFELDESPYGVRHMAGNVEEWCADAWHRDGPPIVDGRMVREVAEGPGRRVVRGGHWLGTPNIARGAGRVSDPPTNRAAIVGFRVACSWPPSEAR